MGVSDIESEYKGACQEAERHVSAWAAKCADGLSVWDPPIFLNQMFLFHSKVVLVKDRAESLLGIVKEKIAAAEQLENDSAWATAGAVVGMVTSVMTAASSGHAAGNLSGVAKNLHVG